MQGRRRERLCDVANSITRIHVRGLATPPPPPPPAAAGSLLEVDVYSEGRKVRSRACIVGGK